MVYGRNLPIYNIHFDVSGLKYVFLSLNYFPVITHWNADLDLNKVP